MTGSTVINKHIRRGQRETERCLGIGVREKHLNYVKSHNNYSRDLKLKHQGIKAAKFSFVPSVYLPSKTELQEKSIQAKNRDLEGLCCEEPGLLIPQVEYHMLLAFPGEKNSKRLLPTPQ